MQGFEWSNDGLGLLALASGLNAATGLPHLAIHFPVTAHETSTVMCFSFCKAGGDIRFLLLIL